MANLDFDVTLASPMMKKRLSSFSSNTSLPSYPHNNNTSSFHSTSPYLTTSACKKSSTPIPRHTPAPPPPPPSPKDLLAHRGGPSCQFLLCGVGGGAYHDYPNESSSSSSPHRGGSSRQVVRRHGTIEKSDDKRDKTREAFDKMKENEKERRYQLQQQVVVSRSHSAGGERQLMDRRLGLENGGGGGGGGVSLGERNIRCRSVSEKDCRGVITPNKRSVAHHSQDIFIEASSSIVTPPPPSSPKKHSDNDSARTLETISVSLSSSSSSSSFEKKAKQRTTTGVSSSLRTLSGPVSLPAVGTVSQSRCEIVDCHAGLRLHEEFVKDVFQEMDTTFPFYFQRMEVRNVVSEPLASNFKVRGRNYMSDNVKVPSAPSLFAVIGVDNVNRPKGQHPSSTLHMSQHECSYYNRMKRLCARKDIHTPFLLIINLNLPWGNMLAYMYRPDSNNNNNNPCSSSSPSDKLWNTFLSDSTSASPSDICTSKLKLIPCVREGPWLVKKLVGSQPVVVGRKLPVSYYSHNTTTSSVGGGGGGDRGGYLEITLDVTQGSATAQKIATAVASKAESITVDLAFVIQGDHQGELPERVLGVFRLHKVAMGKWRCGNEWMEEVQHREKKREMRERR